MKTYIKGFFAEYTWFLVGVVFVWGLSLLYSSNLQDRW
ncbi:hypothetical protein BAOM_3054 [Peribacillus asahii]|uniref:Uncharacterized protein n=1 Tax=Peribacillus asahii TaxID=228899 RepID=A0A3T0KTS0_9BACI|nr:hypothetical protein BAOM_3054 [Peribacillus asahii]